MFSEKNIQLIWQTGLSFADEAKNRVEENNNVKVKPFITKMDLAYSVADVIVSRAGASTISELCLVGKPVILIPSPNVAEDHQTKNALSLTEKQAALLVPDSKAKEQLPIVVKDLLNNPKQQEQLSQNIIKLAKYQSAEKIAQEVINLFNHS